MQIIHINYSMYKMVSLLTLLNRISSYFTKREGHDNVEVTDHEMNISTTNSDEPVNDYILCHEERVPPMYLCLVSNKDVPYHRFSVIHQMCKSCHETSQSGEKKRCSECHEHEYISLFDQSRSYTCKVRA